MGYDIFSVGDNVADYYPAEKKIYAGGGAYNTAVIAKRLGAKAAYYGAFGTDENAKFLYDTLKKENVAYPFNDIRKGRNAVSIITKRGAEAQVKAVDKGIYKNLSINNELLKIFKNSKIVHSNIYSYFEDYLPKLHYKTKISFDFSDLRNENYIKDVIPRVDIAFFSGSNRAESPKDFLNWISEFGVEAAILTLGEAGVLMKFGDQFIEKEALQVNAVDTLGAGDAFIAAFLTSLIEKENNYPKALNCGLKSAAKYCKIEGGLGVFETRNKDIKIYKNIHE